MCALACDSTATPPPASRPAPPPPPAGAAAPSPAPDSPDFSQTVARVSYLAGDVSFSRGDDPDTWEPVDLNVPMTLGDRLWTGENGRVELQIHGGNLVRLAARTDLQALNLTGEVKQLSLALGTATFSVRRLSDDEVFEVDTPNAALTFERPGEYRVDVDPEGNSRVQVRRGRAVAAAGGSQVTLAAGQELDVEGVDAPRYAIVAMPGPDGWDGWVEERDRRLAAARSYAYVSADVAGAEDLDQYGRWQQIPQYGWAWTPAGVGPGWAPYVSGRWIWQDPWGWTWVGAEPWGWAPYHYGRWAYWGGGWYWVPVAPAVRIAAYSPALVAFVGGTGGYVGWFPLAPRDPYYAWWRPAPVGIASVTYVNRSYVTVVNQTVFVSGGLVAAGVVRDRAVVRTIETAPVLRGPVPVVPTRASLRMTTRAATAPRPPATASRSVVTRVAPPPAPPRFDAKVPVIREKNGAPVSPSDAARLASSDAGRSSSRARPATSGGSPALAPRDARPQPTAPAERPASMPETRPTPVGRPPARQPYARPTASSVPPPPRPTPIPPEGERHVQPRVVREAPQPAERVAPEHGGKAKENKRPTPHPKKTPKKE